MNPSTLIITYQRGAVLCLTVPDVKSYIAVKPAWAAPLTRPGRYLALLDAKGDEIVLLPDPKVLLPASWKAVEQELQARYLTSTILTVHSAHEESGATYWDVDTNRGRHEFITQNLQENVQWLGDDHLLLLDVDNCRYEIPSVASLDAHSREIVEDVL